MLGGAGVICFEVCAYMRDGGNPHQLFINNDSLENFKILLNRVDKVYINKHGFKPYKIPQLSHSGRTAHDIEGNLIGKTAFLNPYVDQYCSNLEVVTDAKNMAGTIY